MIKIFQLNGIALIGELASGPTASQVIVNPRVLRAIPDQSGNIRVDILQILGNPKEVDLGSVMFSYQADCEPEFVRAYKEAVTGVILPVKPAIHLVKG